MTKIKFKDAPLTLAEFTARKSDFQDLYQIQQDPFYLTYADLDALNLTGSIELGDDSIYLTFFYSVILVDDVSKLTYVVNQTTIDGIGMNLPVDNYKYFEVAGNSLVSLDPDSTTTLEELQGNYITDQALKLEITDEAFVSVEDFVNHPLTCSFQYDNIKEFLSENDFNSENDYLWIDHLAALNSMVTFPNTSEASLVHGVGLYIADKSNENIRMNNNTESGPSFKNKAFDIGKLCPPDCANM
jgi:hypothetical protein